MEVRLLYKKIVCVVLCLMFVTNNASDQNKNDNNWRDKFSGYAGKTGSYVGNEIVKPVLITTLAGTLVYVITTRAIPHFFPSQQNDTTVIPQQPSSEQLLVMLQAAEAGNSSKKYELEKAQLEAPIHEQQALLRRKDQKLRKREIALQERLVEREEHDSLVRRADVYKKDFEDCLQRNPDNPEQCTKYENYRHTSLQLAMAINQNQYARLQVTTNGIGISANFE